MTRLAEAIAAEMPRKGPRCGFATLKLAKADQADLDAALANDLIAGTAIARGLKNSLGIVVGADTVNRHRRGECGCAR